MALIPADGSGLASANCYIDEAELDAYALLRNIDLSAYSTAQKEAAIYISANDFIDAMHCFKGAKIDASQGMALYTDEVTFDLASKDIKNVNAMTAVLQLQGKLFIETSVDDKYGDIKSQQDKLDVLETKVEYSEGTAKSGATLDTYVADGLLKKYLTVGSGSPRLIPT